MISLQKKKILYIFFPLALFSLAKNKKKNPLSVVTTIIAPHVSVGKDLCKFVIEQKDNFHIVENGNLYRSAQLSPKKLKKIIKEYGIKTIINLRGKNPDKNWWQNERIVAQELDVHFYNIPMRANSFPKKDHLLKLLDLYENTPRPIYIHCKAGSDRTGEAAAIYILEQMGGSKKQALKQLSLKYKHIELKYPKKKKLIKMWQGRNWIENGGYENEILPLQRAAIV
ncbi:hypothetical protein GF385_04225 [Candidatus Dependentiae bacterium]|nr:hypothetical protein [Candidatus Dependentiae bacterium]